MRIGSTAFLLCFIPAITLLYLFVFPSARKRWPWWFALNLVFLASRGTFALLFTMALSIFVFKFSGNLKGNSKRYWTVIAVCLAAWIGARAYEGLGLSVSYMMFFLIAYMTETYWGKISENKRNNRRFEA